MSDEDDIEEMMDDMVDEENEISNWDYRLLVGEDGLLTVGEVYYNSENKPVAWRMEAAPPLGENVEEIIQDLKKMLDATNKPIFTPPKEKTDD